MNKKISELPKLTSVSLNDSFVVLDTSTGETKSIEFLKILSTSVGDVKLSMLSPEQFSSENYGTWMLMNGQSCLGTRYQSITGNSNVPNALTEGHFFRQAKEGRPLGSLEEDEFKSHTHIQNAHYHHEAEGYSSAGHWGGDNLGKGAVFFNHGDGFASISHRTESIVATNQNTGGAETRPKNIALNFFIRVD